MLIDHENRVLDTQRRADYHAPYQLEFPFTEARTMAPEQTLTIRAADPKVIGQLEHIQRQLMQISERYSGPWVKQVMEAADAAGRAATGANGTLEGGDLESTTDEDELDEAAREEEF